MPYDFSRVVDRRHSDSVKWREYGEDVLPLWIADMDFPSPPPVIQALHERVEHAIFGYGTEPPELQPLLMERLHRFYGWQVPPEALVFLPGVAVGFNLACRALVGSGEGVLVQTPLYPPILAAPANARVNRHEMELTRQPDGHYEIDFEAFDRAICEQTRLFILCNPHNPVGRAWRRDELERLAEICLRHGLTICADEVHCDIVYPGHQHLPIASLSPEIAERTITLMSPSKTFNMPGLHWALAIIPNPKLRNKLAVARAGLIQRPHNLGTAAALAAYRDGQPWVDDLLLYLKANRDFLVDYVTTQLPGIHVAKPEGTYLAWLDCRGAGIPGNPHEFFLREARVALNNGSTFGRGGEGFVRLNFGCPRPILREALERMGRALTPLSSICGG